MCTPLCFRQDADNSRLRQIPQTIGCADAAGRRNAGAVGAGLGDADRAERLLALTGLTPDVLRDNLSEPATLCAVLEFLARYEPDLVKAAEALQVDPAALVAAQELLSR